MKKLNLMIAILFVASVTFSCKKAGNKGQLNQQSTAMAKKSSTAPAEKADSTHKKEITWSFEVPDSDFKKQLSAAFN